jgi:hypothetical protein
MQAAMLARLAAVAKMAGTSSLHCAMDWIDHRVATSSRGDLVVKRSTRGPVTSSRRSNTQTHKR